MDRQRELYIRKKIRNQIEHQNRRGYDVFRIKSKDAQFLLDYIDQLQQALEEQEEYYQTEWVDR